MADGKTCGCKEGAAFTLAALLAWPAWILLSGDHSFERMAPAAVAYPFVVIAAGVIGKLFGMLVAHR